MTRRRTLLLAIVGLALAGLVGSGCGSRYILEFSDVSAERNGDEVTFAGTLECGLVGVDNCGTSQCIRAEWYRQFDSVGNGDDAGTADAAMEPLHGGDAHTSENGGDDAHTSENGADTGVRADEEETVGNPDLSNTYGPDRGPVASAEGCRTGVLRDGDEATKKITPDEAIPRDDDFVIVGSITEVSGDEDRPGELGGDVYLKSP